MNSKLGEPEMGRNLREGNDYRSGGTQTSIPHGAGGKGIKNCIIEWGRSAKLVEKRVRGL